MVPTKIFKIYYDPSHAWMAVKRDLLLRYVKAEDISSYSYQKGKTVYLEEDCDAIVFMSALSAAEVAFGVKEIDVGMKNPIRYYQHYQP